MSNLSINSKEFFSNYIFHPKDPSLSEKDSRKALIASVVLGILSLGIVYLVCLIKYRNVKHITVPSGTESKVDNIVQNRQSDSVTRNITPPQAKPSQYDAINRALAADKPKDRLDLLENIAATASDNVEKGEACNEIAQMYLLGDDGDTPEDSVEKNISRAVPWLKEGIKAGDSSLVRLDYTLERPSKLLLDIYKNNQEIDPEADELYEITKFLNVNTYEYIRIMNMAADKGSAKAMFAMAELFTDHGENANSRAVELYKQAAEKEHPEACIQLARYYLGMHNAAHEDRKEAVKYLLLAFVNGARNVKIDMNSEKLLEDKSDALDFLEEFYNEDSWINSSLNEVLADVYIENERIVEVDIAGSEPTHQNLRALAKEIETKHPLKAFNLNILAANKGNADAMFFTGFELYWESKYLGSNRDPNEIIKWFERAAEQKDAKACDYLANIYLFGDSGRFAVDLNKGAKWLLRAIDYNNYATLGGPREEKNFETIRLTGKEDTIKFLKDRFGFDASTLEI